MIQVLAGAGSVRKRIEDAFTTSVTDLDEQSTPDNMSVWDKLTGSSFGTANGRLNTATTTNSIYVLKNGYKSARITAAIDAQTGGDAIYFRVKDANNWMRVREYSTYSSTYNQCVPASVGGYTVTVDPPNAGCSGIFSSVEDHNGLQTVCGTTIIGFSNFQYEYRPDCYTSTPYKLLSYYNYGWSEVTTTNKDWQYSVAIEKMENGSLSTIGTPKTYSKKQIVTSNWEFGVPTTGAQPNDAHNLVVTVTPTSIAYSGYNVSDSVTNSDLADFTGIGLGRGTSSIYTSSGLSSIAIDIL